MKYFFSFAVGGCLLAIAFSAFLTEMVRLIPIVPLWVLPPFWGIVAIALGITVIFSGTQHTWGEAWKWGLALVIFGGCCGLA